MAAGEASKTYANASECRLRLGDFALAESAASRALELDGANTKARFRRGRARLERGDYEGAMADLGAVVDLPETYRALGRRRRRHRWRGWCRRLDWRRRGRLSRLRRWRRLNG